MVYYGFSEIGRFRLSTSALFSKQHPPIGRVLLVELMIAGTTKVSVERSGTQQPEEELLLVTDEANPASDGQL